MDKIKNLFLRQSYQDAWTEYRRSLEKASMIKWDYFILTASNEEQANAYRMQIEDRIEKGYLPKETHYAVLPDPDGKRVGSGGATFNVLKYIKSVSGGEDFKNKRILVIHSGGDSKRVPQYSACGKLFSPVPRLLPDGRRSTLFDEFIISMSGVAPRIKEGMLVLSGDVLLLFNFLQIDFYCDDAAAISIKEDVDTGKDHGVFVTDENGKVTKFLHKNTIEKLKSENAVDSYGNVDLDTGAILMNSKMLEDLYSLINTDEKFDEFVNEKARISFYADLLYPLAENSTLEAYYKEAPEGDFTPELKACRDKIWEAMRKYRLTMISLSPAQFIHFGTTRELLALMTEDISDFEFLDWSDRVICNKDFKGKCAVSNSFIDAAAEVSDNCYIEDSEIIGNCKIGEHCVISNMVLKDTVVPDNTVLHGLKLKDGRYIVRQYKTDTNPKENDFWNEKAFTVADSFEASLKGEGNEKMSLCESFNKADVDYILKSQNALNEKIRVHNFLIDIKEHINVDKALLNFGEKGMNEAEVKAILDIAESQSFEVKNRIYFYLSRVPNITSLCSMTKEQLEGLCFDSIRQTILEGSLSKIRYDEAMKIAKDEVNVNLPIRVNWGGGWSDTPPFCNENGGAVINAAVKLNGINPVMVEVRRLKEYHIELESKDSRDFEVITDAADIQACGNPFDPFALHKAALIAYGVVPYTGEVSLEEILKKMGGGFYLSTRVVGIPRGSGLGTSSILSAACIKGLAEFFGKPLTSAQICAGALCMEQIMSSGGDWQDQVGGIDDGIKFITSEPGISQELVIEKVELSDKTKEELSERFALIYTGQRRLARNLLREVVGRYVGGREDIIKILFKIQRIAALMKFELEKGNIDNFAKLLNEQWDIAKKIDEGCTNTCIEQMFKSIEDLIDGRFIAGAGGGGFLQVILKKGVTKEELRERIKSVFRDTGIDVWDAEFVF